MPNLPLLKNIYYALYDPKTDTKETIETYFHPDYEQCINGITMDRTQFTDHVILQKTSLLFDAIDFKSVLEEKNKLFAIYYARGTDSNHQPIEAEVIAYFCFKDQKIISIHGQVRFN